MMMKLIMEVMIMSNLHQNFGNLIIQKEVMRIKALKKESDKRVMTTMLGAAIARGDFPRVRRGRHSTSHSNFPKFHVKRNEDDLGFLIQRWSPNSHTFFASLGELSPTLEDVHELLRLPSFGNFDIVSQSLPSTVVDVANSLKEELRKCSQWVPCTANKDT
ncbi:Aminotransferase-like mobile domain containing protein [Senna tora]|uniref:Aminotransferase-like mobile domain containing protein n=1 Tax=Senna tora TaxID=362788 RepID=A0A834TH34_9FABA|nr:Aminotransferase-like mobile domain containing protein [Senna tora]